MKYRKKRITRKKRRATKKPLRGGEPPKVAILLSGRIKGYTDVMKKIQEKYDTTIFCSLNKKNKSPYIQTFCDTFKIGDEQLNLEPTITPEWIPTIPKKVESNSYEGTYSMFYHIYKAFELCKAYSQKHTKTFDYVIFFRADIQSDNILELIPLAPNTIYIPDGFDFDGGLNGLMAYGSMEVMEKYSNIVNNMHKMCVEQKLLFHPESFVKKHLENENITIVRFPYSLELNPARQQSLPAYNDYQ